MFKTKEKAKALEEEGPRSTDRQSIQERIQVVITGMIKELGRRMAV